jgi:hypothetical protein
VFCYKKYKLLIFGYIKNIFIYGDKKYINKKNISSKVYNNISPPRSYQTIDYLLFKYKLLSTLILNLGILNILCN